MDPLDSFRPLPPPPPGRHRRPSRLVSALPGVVAVALLAGTGLLLGLALALGTSAIAAPASRGLNRDTRFYTPQPNQGAVSQIVDLAKKHDFRDAALLAQMAGTPQAKWFTSGTPADVRTGVRTVVTDAAR